jgi:hypothetical protein
LATSTASSQGHLLADEPVDRAADEDITAVQDLEAHAVGDLPFDMELAISPPSRVAVGITLDTPLVVTFNASEMRGRRASEEEQGFEMEGIWAFLSLVTEDRSRSLAPPRDDLVRGKRVDSVHRLHRDEEQDAKNETVAYASFPDIAITKPGRYCFRVSVIDINR